MKPNSPTIPVTVQRLRCMRCGHISRSLEIHEDARTANLRFDDVYPSDVATSKAWCDGPFALEDHTYA